MKQLIKAHVCSQQVYVEGKWQERWIRTIPLTYAYQEGHMERILPVAAVQDVLADLSMKTICKAEDDMNSYPGNIDNVEASVQLVAKEAMMQTQIDKIVNINKVNVQQNR